MLAVIVNFKNLFKNSNKIVNKFNLYCLRKTYDIILPVFFTNSDRPIISCFNTGWKVEIICLNLLFFKISKTWMLGCFSADHIKDVFFCPLSTWRKNRFCHPYVTAIKVRYSNNNNSLLQYTSTVLTFHVLGPNHRRRIYTEEKAKSLLLYGGRTWMPH